MKKRYFAALAAAAGAGAWCLHRDRKYPLRPELRFTNKLVVPGAMLNPKTAGLANRALARMALTLPDLPQGVESRGTQILKIQASQLSLHFK